MARIVVGVDGSTESLAALRWAVEEARLRDAELEVLHAYSSPDEYSPYSIAYSSAYLRSTPMSATTVQEVAERRAEEVRAAAEDVLSAALDSTGVSTAGLALTRRVVPDDRPARALVEAARDADLLVVGSRGRGGFAGLVLGSVSQQCAHHAPCPVTIVRGVL